MKNIRLSGVIAAVMLVASVVSASADWAIAVGQGDRGHYAYGTANNQSSVRVARRVAMEGCRDNGPGCKVIAEGSGSCAAIAFGTDDNAYGWSEGDTEREASRSAQKKCLQYTNGGACEVRGSFCDN
jgi:hypothetical protein